MPTALVSEATANRIFSEHRTAIQRFLLSMTRNPAEAEDLTQETLLRAHAKLATLEDDSKIVPWLYRIATNIARDRFRQPSWRQRSVPLETGDSEPALPVLDDAPRLDKVMEQREMSDCVRRYLEDLADPYRAVILLHDVQGLTNSEMAELLGVTVDAAKIRLHRARTKLRAALAAGCSFERDDRGVLVCRPRSDSGPQRDR
jgi:RNA polymerase sigma-70 factor (ECF subfamily)